MRSLSAAESDTPSRCVPSRSVVSKISTTSAMTRLPDGDVGLVAAQILELVDALGEALPRERIEREGHLLPVRHDERGAGHVDLHLDVRVLDEVAMHVARHRHRHEAI